MNPTVKLDPVSLGLQQEPFDEDRSLFRQWMFFEASSWNPPRLFDSPPDRPVWSPSGRYFYINKLRKANTWYPAYGNWDVNYAFDGDTVTPELHDVTFNGFTTLMCINPYGILSERTLWERAVGTVLHAGLGLGWLAAKLNSVPEVKEIILVEIDQELLDWYGHELLAGLNKIRTTICGDVWDYVGKFGPDVRHILDHFYSFDSSSCDPRYLEARKKVKHLACWGDTRMRVYGWAPTPAMYLEERWKPSATAEANGREHSPLVVVTGAGSV